VDEHFLTVRHKEHIAHGGAKTSVASGIAVTTAQESFAGARSSDADMSAIRTVKDRCVLPERKSTPWSFTSPRRRSTQTWASRCHRICRP